MRIARSGTMPARQLGAAGMLGLAAGLVLLTASMWWGWFAWDDQYQVDPATGGVSGPYEAWQVIGCVVCLVVLTVIAARVLHPAVVVVLMSVSFTAAFAFTAVRLDDSGLAFIGVLLMAMGTFVGFLVVVGLVRGAEHFRAQHRH